MLRTFKLILVWIEGLGGKAETLPKWEVYKECVRNPMSKSKHVFYKLKVINLVIL